MRRLLGRETEEDTAAGEGNRMMLLFWAGGGYGDAVNGLDKMGWMDPSMDGMEWPENARQTRPTGLRSTYISTATVEVNGPWILKNRAPRLTDS